MCLPTDDTLIRWQQDLETTLTAFADHELRQATARISEPAVHNAAAAYLPARASACWAWRSSTPHTP